MIPPPRGLGQGMIPGMTLSVRRTLSASVLGFALVACGSEGNGGDAEPATGRSSDEASSAASEDGGADDDVPVAAGTREAAQAAVDEAEDDLFSNASAQYAMSWVGESEDVPILSGAFDLAAPAYRQSYEVSGASLEMRAIPGHVWSQVSGAEIAPELANCWMHMTTGTGDEAEAAAVPPMALMLVEPKVLGFQSGTEDVVVVEFLLDEATPAMMPKVANQLAGGIDPTATVRGTVHLVDGRYASLEYNAGDVIDAFDADELPDEIAGVEEVLGEVRVRIAYSGFGKQVKVSSPAPDRVIEVGSRDDLLAGRVDPDVEMGTCAANR